MIRLFFWSKWGLVRLVISFVISSLISLVFCTELYYKLWLSDLGPRHFSFSKYLVVQSQLCPALCDPMDCSTSGFPVHHQFPEVIQTHVHWVGDLILCHPLLLPPSIFPSIRVFSNELALCIRWPKYWNFSFSISPSNEYSGLISFRIEWFDLLAVQGLPRVSSNTTVHKHQFFSTQLSL